jgi:hypothetical protein
MDAARGAVHDAVHTVLSTPAMEALKVIWLALALEQLC